MKPLLDAPSKRTLYKREWRKKHPEWSTYMRAYNKEYRRTRNTKRNAFHTSSRLELIELYGGACRQCGITDVRVLQFDHVNGDGNNWGKRKSMPERRVELAESFAANDGKFQLLCANCHVIKTREQREYGKVRNAR